MILNDLNMGSSLRYCTIGARVDPKRLPGSDDTPIFLRALDCQSGVHTNILDCESDLGITRCSHNQDVVVHCEGKQCMIWKYPGLTLRTVCSILS